MARSVSVGIDVGGTVTKIGIVDKQGDLLTYNTIDTTLYNDIEAFINGLYITIEECLSGLDEAVALKGIGVGAPNANYYKGTIEHATNLKWKGVLPFVELFNKYYNNIPIVLTNDANAAALGEFYYGGGQEMKDFIVITLGTGLGGGVIVNGNLLLGKNSIAGELGHLNVKPNGRQCGCGRRGCLETYVSATGLKRTVIELLAEENEESELRNLGFNQMDSKLVSQAADHGDPIANMAFNKTGRILGRAMADMVVIFNPEAIFLMGGLANAGEIILNPAKESMEKNVMDVFKGQTPLMVSKLQQQGKNIAVLGASALAWKQLDIESH